ncbi:MAG: hypothetical protein ACRDRI_19750 [Pseudonocardiaceae bacterium]
MVTVTTDDGREWLFEEPGWRNLCYGVVDRQFYWWSARHLVAIPLRPGDDLVEVWTDEDILFVFAAPGGEWLMVCETSVRLLDGDRELSRVELAEAIADVRWNRPYLLVNDVSGISIRVTLVEGGLVA